MKKQLTDDTLLNELRDSAFFRGRVSPASNKETAKKPVLNKAKKKTPLPRKEEPEEKLSEKKSSQDNNDDTAIPRHHDTTTPWYHDTTVEMIRKAVKQIGKEAATHRYTETEKKAIAGIIFAYRSQGVFTSENQVSRIAINFMIQDFENNGEESVLAKCLKALND